VRTSRLVLGVIAVASLSGAIVLTAGVGSTPRPALRAELTGASHAGSVVPVHPAQTWQHRRPALPKVTASPAATAALSVTTTADDTLSSLAAQYLGGAGNWPALYLANKTVIGGNPDSLHAGEVLSIPQDVSGLMAQWSASQPPPQSSAPAPAPVSPPAGSGVLSPAQVGAVWTEAGGPASQEMVAECVAHAESGDNPAENNYEDNGGTQTSWRLYQVSNGTHEEYIANLDDPLVNAKQAVIKYDASGWAPWTTAPGCGA
jgi:hypothetical protein